jgi:2-polyprenyl-3-methyl-5-hydroxy-6-metoxy-1,4-benzoquinol methylase
VNSPETITQAVRQQYESFPYPPEVPAIKSFGLAGNFILGQYLRTRSLMLPTGKRALVAGCGTGSEIDVISITNPGLSEIIGCDISTVSVNRANERIQKYYIKNAQAIVADILDDKALPEGPFDLITCYGVLHHTADPVKGLAHLAKRLAPDGVMSIMLYNRSGRMMIYRMREALTLLGIDPLPLAEKIKFVQGLLPSIQPESLLLAKSMEADREYYAHVENLVDNFFHAQDVPFDIGQVPPFLEQAGLTFLDIIPVGVSYWNPDTVISPIYRAFYDYYDQLPKIKQLQIMELLAPSQQTQNVFWCCHANAVTAEADFTPFTREWFSQNHWQLNPTFWNYAQIAYLDQKILLKDLTPNTRIPTEKVELLWTLFRNRTQKSVLTRWQLLTLLYPLAHQPKLGSDILDLGSPEQQDHILGLFQHWEKARITLRV